MNKLGVGKFFVDNDLYVDYDQRDVLFQLDWTPVSDVYFLFKHNASERRVLDCFF